MRMVEQPLEILPRVRDDVNRGDHYDSVIPLPPNLIRVPAVKQRTDFSCGTAATLAVLRYWRWDSYAQVDEAALYLPLETTSARGTEPQPIATFLSTVGAISAEYRHGDVTVADLERAVDSRQPPIVDLQAWRDHPAPWGEIWDAGHYVVMIGYDDRYLFFMDPCTLTAPGGYAFLPRAEFEERWHDLSGDHDVRVDHMAIFTRGSRTPWTTNEPLPEGAAKLG
jgi:hypothetical protein